MKSTLEIVVDGEGTAWIDDVVIERLGAAPATTAAPVATPSGT